MDGEAAIAEEEKKKKGECGTNVSSSCFVHHKRSKSASDKNLDVSRNRTLYNEEKNCNKSKNLLDIVRSHGVKGSLNYIPSDNTDIGSLDSRDSLENDIKQLQMHLHQEKSVRVMLERAIGRASSTLSPGHRHFATKTRELISEIEILEEEIANREQHVLSLYRSIFEQCASAPSSAQSSGMASPLHPKKIVRKHPSIISAAFCSSKKFPLKAFNVLAPVKESGKSNTTTYPKVRSETSSTGNINFHIRRDIPENMKKCPDAQRNYLACTLKEHLYQCPSKLSEELVRCMATIYYWIGSKEYDEPQKVRSPFLSRSSTSVVLPRRGAGNQQESSSSLVEIYSISMDKNHFSSASCAISNYRLLVEQLERVDAGTLESSVKLAFWINIYNSLVMHAYVAYGISHNSLRRMALFHKATYNVGGHTISANTIENSILCCRSPRIGRWFETILSTAMRKKYGEEKQIINSKFGLFTSQPLVLFSLCNGAASDPTLRVYTAKNVIEELGKAKKEFLNANVVVKKSRKIYLPRVLERYAKEQSLSCDDLLSWVFDNIDKKTHETNHKCIDSNNRRKKASRVIEWLPYNTRFRYVFEKNLAEKPQWA